MSKAAGFEVVVRWRSGNLFTRTETRHLLFDFKDKFNTYDGLVSLHPGLSFAVRPVKAKKKVVKP